jgi:hypothetical protein
MMKYFVSLVFGIGLISRLELFAMRKKYTFRIHLPFQPFFREMQYFRQFVFSEPWDFLLGVAK